MKKQNLMIVSVFAGVLMLSLVSAGWFSNIFTGKAMAGTSSQISSGDNCLSDKKIADCKEFCKDKNGPVHYCPSCECIGDSNDPPIVAGSSATPIVEFSLRTGSSSIFETGNKNYKVTSLEQNGELSCFDFTEIESHERKNVCLKDNEEKVIEMGGKKIRLRGTRGKKSFGSSPLKLKINLEGSQKSSSPNEPLKKPVERRSLFNRIFGIHPKEPAEEPVTPVEDHTMEHPNNGNSIGNLASGENQTGTCTCYDQADFYDQAFFHDEVNFLADEVNVHSGVSFKLNDAVHPGYAFACFDSAGKLFRSDIACNLISSGTGSNCTSCWENCIDIKQHPTWKAQNMLDCSKTCSCKAYPNLVKLSNINELEGVTPEMVGKVFKGVIYPKSPSFIKELRDPIPAELEKMRSTTKSASSGWWSACRSRHCLFSCIGQWLDRQVK